MKIELLDKTKKKKILSLLDEYGIEKLSHLFVKSGKDKIRIYSGNLSKEELNLLGKNLRVEIIGSSLGRIDKKGFRISFDALNIPEIKNQIKDNIFELSDEQTTEWLAGKDFDIPTNMDSEFIVLKNKDDLLGAAKNKKTFIQNYVPKERRIK